MGQRVGRPVYIQSSRPFLNREMHILAFCDGFNDIAEGFAVSPAELRAICDIPSMYVTKLEIDALFRALDTDNNGLVDGLEVLAVAAMASGLNEGATARYIFRLFDFDESGELSLDEMTLALKSVLTGPAKLTGELPPEDQELEQISQLAFLRCDKDADHRITVGEFVDFCLENPEARSWLEYYDDPDQEETGVAGAAAAGAAAGSGAAAKLPLGGGAAVSVDPESEYELSKEARHMQVADSRGAAFEAARRPAQRGSVAEAVRRRAAGAEAPPPPADGPWRDSVQSLIPSSPAEADEGLPDAALYLEYVHGYRGNDCRDNVKVAGDGRIVFPAAGVVVIYDAETRSYEYFLEHEDDVVSLAAHPSGDLFASGEVGKTPKIFVWDAMGNSKKKGVGMSGAGAGESKESEAASGAGSASALGATGSSARSARGVGESSGPDVEDGEMPDNDVDAVACLHGFHTRGVSQLAFSPSGKLLASVGQDDDHSVCVYDWARGEVHHSGKGSVRPVYAAAFRDENTLVTGGKNHIYFWDMASKTKKKGIFGRAPGVRMQTVASIQPFGDPAEGLLATGMASGHVYVWKDRNCLRAIRAHDRAVACLHGMPSGLATGGSDGTVRLWTAGLEPKATLDITACGGYDCAVRAVEWLPDSGTVVVGTKGCEIFEVRDTDGRDARGGPVIQGHCQKEVWGLATHPERAEYVTVGDDGTMRVWDSASRQLVRIARLGHPSRAVCYSPEGDFIAVGLGSGRRHSDPTSEAGQAHAQKEGSFLVVRSADLAVVHAARDANEWITQCKFSPDGRTLAVGSRDSKVYLYNTEDFSLRAVCTRNSSFVTHIDFSSTGEYIQCTDGAHELLFYHAEDGKQEASSATMKDVKWATQTCTLGWAVQGVWPPYADGTDVNALDRARGGDVVAAADDFGRVTLRRFPALLPSAIATESLGHSSHVTNVRFTAGDRHLISVGGNDKSVFQWRVYGDTGPGVDAPPEEHAVPFEPPEESAAAAGAGGRKGRTATRRALDGDDIDSEDEEDLVDGEELGQSDESRAAKSDDAEARMRMKEAAEAAAAGTPGGMAALTVDLRPWMGTLVKPSAPPGSDPELPDCNPRLEWVHGYAGRGYRGNVHYTSEREAVWFAAAVAVVMDPRRWSQRFFTGHTDDVCSIARHPDGIHFATGQLGAEPYVCVWRADTLEEVSRLKGAHERGVCQLAFSGDGKRLASVGLDDNHSFVVWDWRAGSSVYSGPGSKRKTLGVALSEDGRRLLQAGVKTIVVHGQYGRNAVSRRVRLGRLGSLQTFLCAQIHAPDGPDGYEVGLVGTADGHVYVVDLNRRVLAGAVSAHSGSVYSIATGGPRGCVLTGGKDGAIKKWSARMEPDVFRGGAGSDAGKGGDSGGSTDAISLEAQGTAGKSARALAWSQCGTRILAGSSGCEVFEFTAESGANPHEAPLVHSHCKHELWGLATHPTQGEFVTSGDDGMIRIWDIAEKACKAVLSIGGMARAVAMSPDGNAIAVGMGGRVGAGRSRDDGTVQLLALDRQSDGTIGGKVLARRRDSREWIQDIKFSPDGRTVAAASHDNKVYLYSASEQGMPLRAVFDRHHSFITHIDFSKDSRRVQSTCGAHELLFSDAQTGAHIPSAAAVKDVKWATQTCTLGWAVQGVWPPYADGTDVNALDRSRDGSALAAADDFGRVTLRRFPALDPEASCKQLLGHSSHVTNVRFAAGDSHLISVGGGDRCVFQWRLEDDREAAKQLREAVFAGQEAVDEDAELPIEVYRKDMTQAMRGQAPLPSAADGEEVTGELGAALDGAALAQLTSGATSGADGSLGGGARGGGTGRAVDAPAAPVTTSTEGVRVRAASAVVALGVKENASVPAGAIATATMDHSKRTAMGKVGGGGPGGGSFGSTPAFRGALVPPTHPPTAVDAPPKPELRLEWAYGIRARDARGACGYNSTGALVYATAALGVVYDHAKHTQVFYTGHDDDIVSVAVDPSGRFAATGQLGYRPRVHVWDAHSGAGLCVLPVVHESAVTRLSFSADGKSLFSADDGEPYTVAMYSTGSGGWTDGALRAQGTGERKRCFFVQALPGADCGAPSAAGSDDEFVAASGGKNHVRFWRREGRTLECVRGLFGSKGRIQSVLSAAVVRGSLVTGTASGHLYRWKGRVVENATPTSDGSNKLRSVYWIDSRGAAVVLGLRDGTVRIFDADLKPHDTIKLDEAQEKSMDSAVHAVQLRSDGEVLLAVTRGSEIYEVALATGTVTLRAEGHSADELWGLAAHPSAPELALTAGDDGSVRLWDLRTHRAARKAVLEGMARTVSWSPDGTVVAVGLGGRMGGRNTRWKTLAPATTGGGAGMSRREAASAAGASGSSAGRDGVFSLLRADTLEAVHEARDTTRPLTALKFSASGQLLVAGSRDGKVYVYDARGGRFALSRTLSRHVSAVTHVDVSIDGSLVRSQSTSYELLFGRTDQEGEVGRAEEVRDTAWHTETLPIGWAQMGVWPPSADGTDINAVDRSRSGQLLASADDFGGVKLFRYPACPPGTDGGRGRQAYFKRYHGHASHVTCARFTAGDKYLLTTGGADRTLLQWRVIGNDSVMQ